MKKVFAILLALALVLGCSALADDSTLVVSGSASVCLEADYVSAVLGVNLSGKDLASLQQQVNSTVEAICTALVDAGMEEKGITTNYIYITPNYNYGMSSSGEPEFSGYTIENTLSIETDKIDMLGSYIDAAFAAGANSFNSINFSAKDDAQARRLALEMAVKDAWEKAEIIAAASGKTIESIEEIREGGVSSYAKSAYDTGNGYAVMESASEIGTTVRASQVLVSAEVQITYEMK